MSALLNFLKVSKRLYKGFVQAARRYTRLSKISIVQFVQKSRAISPPPLQVGTVISLSLTLPSASQGEVKKTVAFLTYGPVVQFAANTA
jgi:hypothetical protein